MTEIEFGFLPTSTQFEVDNIIVQPLANAADVIASVLELGLIDGQWIYPAIVDKSVLSNVLTQSKIDKIQVPAARFELPTTHILVHKQTKDIERTKFLVSMMGFFLGLRLMPKGWGHFYRTPVALHTLSDFHVANDELQQCIVYADRFWLQHRKKKMRTLIFSAVNAFQIAQSYQHDYERFLFLYTALDTCMEMLQEVFPTKFQKKRIRHWQYARLMVDFLEIKPLPKWARKRRKLTKTVLSETRNAAIHDGLIAGVPFGHDVIGQDMLELELTNLISRAIIRILGVSCRYTSTAINTRQQHSIDLTLTQNQ